MKKTNHEEMRKEYRGKYFEEYKKGTNLVLLSPEIREASPDNTSVSETLCSLVKIARQAKGSTRCST